MLKLKRFFVSLFNRELWSPRFLTAFISVFITILIFDILWCSLTTFRAMSFAGTYLNAILLSLILSLPSIIWKRNFPQWIVTSLFAALLCANLMYCRTYFNSIPLKSYMLVGNVMGFTSSIVDSISPLYLLLFFPSIGAWILMRKYKHHKLGDKKMWRQWISTTVSVFAVSAIVALASGGFLSHVEKLRQGCYYATTPPVIYTLPGSLLAEALHHSDTITPGEKKSVDEWMANHNELLFSLTPCVMGDTLSSTPVARNLVVVFCESLEAWPIGLEVEGKEITPNINREIADTASTWFARRVLTQVGNGRSIEGQLLALTGLYPMRDEVYAMSYADHNYPSLPKAMKQRGAATYLLSGDAPSTWNQAAVASAFGIDSIVMGADWNGEEKIGHPARISDRSFFSQIIDRMKRGEIWPIGERGYVQVVTYTGHNPFKIPDNLAGISLKGNYPEKLHDYLIAANYTDMALGQFLSYLKSRSDWKDTMVVIMGDHEGLASWRDEILKTDGVGHSVDAEGFVPLIILNAPKGGRRDDVMGQVDIYSTLADALKLRSQWYGMGFSAFCKNSPKFAVDRSGRLVGDTIGASEALKLNILRAPAISDLVIKFNLLK